MLTDVKAAQDSLWANTQLTFQTFLLYKNVSVARAAELKQLYYRLDWDPAWDALASSGALVEFDVSYMKNFVSKIRSEVSPTALWDELLSSCKYRQRSSILHILLKRRPGTINLAAHALLKIQKRDGRINLRTIAVVLANQRLNYAFDKVYTPTKSPSAFIMAMTALRHVFM